MHESSPIPGLLKQIEGVARKYSAMRVLGVAVNMGARAPISADHFREHFEQETKGTIVEGANLEIETCDEIGDPHAQEVVLACVEVG